MNTLVMHIGERSGWQWRLWSSKQYSNHDMIKQRHVAKANSNFYQHKPWKQ